MGHLNLVKSLSHFREEQKYSEEVLLDSLGLALTRGTIAEITGEASSGRTSLALNILSKQTREGEVCAVVDLSGSFDPRSAKLAGVALENLFWVKCAGDIEKAFTAADYLVQAKGFGVIWLNLGGLPRQKLKMVPRTYWYRYRNRIKQTPTLLSSQPLTRLPELLRTNRSCCHVTRLYGPAAAASSCSGNFT